MKHIIRKAYWNYEKEERWINELAAKGMNLENYSWAKYTFSEGEPGEYIYRIELLENRANHPESLHYIKFLEENGVEHIASYQSWIYLRKKAADGEFDIYTDIESKIKHYTRVNMRWTALGAAELCVGVGNLGLATSVFAAGETYQILNLNFIGGLLCTILGIFFMMLSRKYSKKIRQLKKEAEIHQ